MLQFKVGDEVFLMNPRAVRQKVAVGNISGLLGEQKFHFKEIPDLWMKVDVRNVFHLGVHLMIEREDTDMIFVEHVKGSAELWDQKYIKLST